MRGINFKIQIFLSRLLVAVFLLSTFYFLPAVTHAAMILHSAGSSNNINTGLVGWWTFDGGDTSGTMTYDKSGSGNSGTRTLGRWGAGKIGQGVVFTNSAANYINVPDPASGVLDFSGTAALTMSAWIKTSRNTSVGNGAMSIICKIKDTANYDGYWLQMIMGGTADDGKIDVRLGTNDLITQTNNKYNDGKWHHVVAVKQPTTGSTQIYVDGVADGTPASDTQDMQNTNSLRIGSQRPAGASEYWDGTIDDVRVYSTALSPNEVYSLYQYGNAKININSAGVSKDKLTNGLVGWWTFDGGDMTSTVALDKSGSGNHGTVVGASKTLGKIGQSLSFDGVDDRVTVSDNAFDFGSGNLTLSAWVYITSSVEGTIVSKDQVTTPHTYYKLYEANGQFVFGIYNSSNCVGGISSVSPTLYPLKKWHHAVGVRDGSGSVKLYVNGQLVDQDTGTACGTLDNAFPLEIGVLRNSSSGWFPGKIDDVRIYGRALSANEIYSLYQYGNAKLAVAPQAVANQGAKSGLVAYWPMNGGDINGAVLYDRAGTNHGTITGTTKVIGKIGQALNFNGTSNSVDLGNSNAFTGTASYTVSSWIKPTSTGVNVIVTRGCTSKTGGGCNPNGYAREYILYTSAGTLNLSRHDGADSDVITSASNTIVLNKWQHVVGTYNGSTMTIYINGVNAGNAASTRSVTGTDQALIGVANEGGTKRFYFSGNIDDVRIYSRALSADEVYSLYKYGK